MKSTRISSMQKGVDVFFLPEVYRNVFWLMIQDLPHRGRADF